MVKFNMFALIKATYSSGLAELKLANIWLLKILLYTRLEVLIVHLIKDRSKK